MMKSKSVGLGRLLLVLSFILLSCNGCVLQREQILYYDRNGDGLVDLERHHFRGAADEDWELRDDDFNGRFEQKVIFGVGIIRSSIDIPVPKRVHIQSKTPAYLVE
jgi:hypothetical protein